MTKEEFQYVLNIRLKAEETRYNPRGPAPCPAATMVETQTPKVFSTRPQGPVLVSDCFLIYPFQLETNGREYVPLSNPVGAPVPVSLQLPYITSSQQDMPSCFATTQACCCCSAKSLQSCPTLCDLIDSSPPGSPLPGILQARTLERIAISFSSA